MLPLLGGLSSTAPGRGGKGSSKGQGPGETAQADGKSQALTAKEWTIVVMLWSFCTEMICTPTDAEELPIFCMTQDLGCVYDVKL